jgi:hypothetical protein
VSIRKKKKITKRKKKNQQKKKTKIVAQRAIRLASPEYNAMTWYDVAIIFLKRFCWAARSFFFFFFVASTIFFFFFLSASEHNKLLNASHDSIAIGKQKNCNATKNKWIMSRERLTLQTMRWNAVEVACLNRLHCNLFKTYIIHISSLCSCSLLLWLLLLPSSMPNSLSQRCLTTMAPS